MQIYHFGGVGPLYPIALPFVGVDKDTNSGGALINMGCHPAIAGGQR